MFAVARRYSGEGAVRLFRELERKRDDIEQTMRGVPGFIAYALFQTREGGITVTICQTRAGIDESIQRAASWVRANVPIAVIPPEVCDGWIASIDRQAAISEVLELISRSAFDLRKIMEVLLESAVRLCDAEFGMIYRHSSAGLEVLALHPPDAEIEKAVKGRAGSLTNGSFVGRVQREATVLNLANIRDDTDLEEGIAALHDRLGLKAALGVPLSQLGGGLTGGPGESIEAPSGVMTIFRTQNRAFADLHVQLAQTFADQAAIAIEYIRLLGEVQQKTREVEQLRIEIDEVRRNREVSAIVKSDTFRELQEKARRLRKHTETREDAEGHSLYDRIGHPPKE